MTKLAPEWVRTSDPVIRSPARYRWTTAHVRPMYKKANNNSQFLIYKPQFKEKYLGYLGGSPGVPFNDQTASILLPQLSSSHTNIHIKYGGNPIRTIWILRYKMCIFYFWGGGVLMSNRAAPKFQGKTSSQSRHIYNKKQINNQFSYMCNFLYFSSIGLGPSWFPAICTPVAIYT